MFKNNCTRREREADMNQGDSDMSGYFLKYRVGADYRISKKENMQQFEDHQHYKAAARLSQSNHQVQILFVRACINMYLSLWKTVPGKQL